MPRGYDRIWDGLRLEFISSYCMFIIICFQGMDIPDVEIVVVYGLPKTAAQLYQVVKLAIIKCNVVIG